MKALMISVLVFSFGYCCGLWFFALSFLVLLVFRLKLSPFCSWNYLFFVAVNAWSGYDVYLV